MTLKSKFRFFGFMPGFLFLLVIFLVISTLPAMLDPSAVNGLELALVLGIIMVLVLIWTGAGELRTKALAATIQTGSITVRNFYGLGPTRSFKLNAFNGFTTSLLSSKYNTFEYLYLMKGDKKVLKLSEYYHKNYDELKAELEKAVPFLGEIPFSLIDEFKEIVR